MTEQWLEVRRQLLENRYRWGVEAADDYPPDRRVAGTPLLAPRPWIPAEPIPLASIRLEFDPSAEFSGVTGREPFTRQSLPLRPDRTRYPSYADAIAALAPPSVFEDRPTYRLLSADLTGPSPTLRLGRGTYFDSINTGEASAHEYAARRLGLLDATPLRDAIGDPWNPARRPTNLAISTLTIRTDRTTGDSTFYLHWRDPTKVAHAAGLYQVVPSGIFQPSAAASWNERNDFDLWRNLIRELAEELRGDSEDHGSDSAAIEYESWPFAVQLNAALSTGAVKVYCVGLGVDPLTFATDLLTVLVIDSDAFDTFFPSAIDQNTEGRVLTPQPLTARVVDEFIRHKPVQAAGAALLQLAWANAVS
jgi:hypothetical protein